MNAINSLCAAFICQIVNQTFLKVLVSLSDLKVDNPIPIGAGWTLAGAMCYASYLVLLKRKVDHEDKLSIPMFFGNQSLR